ncbi:hypothetical protein AWB69_03178 [Caballeronia udeis]|uniref:Uncharacterized protein n=1 Tax=Caballeronia udeis TaxID=1232866 RepID=A0A158GR62_9BURK|nr:hypothetical protein AWB69_03178 [Caballeronia udeis]
MTFAISTNARRGRANFRQKPSMDWGNEFIYIGMLINGQRTA